MLRIESHARDFQSDVIPKRVFDFIGHQKNLEGKSQSVRQSKRKLAKQYLERCNHTNIQVLIHYRV